MIQDILIALWFFLPAGAANVAPVLVAKGNQLAVLAKPLDGGKYWRGKRIFGDNKTWRGMVVGIVAAIIVLAVQQLIVKYSPGVASYFSAIDYLALPTILTGLLFAVGALGGDAIASFFKRQNGIDSGRSWVPFDQLDYVIGSILLTAPVVLLTTAQYAWSLALWCGVHLLVSYIGYKLGFKARPI